MLPINSFPALIISPFYKKFDHTMGPGTGICEKGSVSSRDSIMSCDWKSETSTLKCRYGTPRDKKLPSPPFHIIYSWFYYS